MVWAARQPTVQSNKDPDPPRSTAPALDEYDTAAVHWAGLGCTSRMRRLAVACTSTLRTAHGKTCSASASARRSLMSPMHLMAGAAAAGAAAAGAAAAGAGAAGAAAAEGASAA
ncbi:hypothetical protein HaLaN_25495 [Haematococcus lacustris]|uniref:Uncharacterized protein n=1 Tax=Haematococcus lacustris TaxID=44745 RepID=A0A699ZWC1_HAELA|nr:hypothetical protein HaLaN_25495 [Haematococcus lacustris]